MAPTSMFARLFVVVATGSFLVHACSAADLGGEGGAGNYGGLGGFGSFGGNNVIMPDASAPQGGQSGDGDLNPLCAASACNPDRERSCADYVPAGGAAQQIIAFGGAGGEAGFGGVAGAAEGGIAGAGGEFAAAGLSGGGGIDGAGGFSGFGGSESTEGGFGGAALETPSYACRVVRAGSAARTECSPSGEGRLGGPCFDSSNCAAGFACVIEGAVGRCRPFCCGGESSCDPFPGTYCAERALREEPAPARSLDVPVCMTADNCDLAKAPCRSAGECECAPGTACQVVRSDGTTTCVEPGSGKAGMACPCAYGFVCSHVANKCFALCQTDAPSSWPGGCGRCQASAELPKGWGVCIGN